MVPLFSSLYFRRITSIVFLLALGQMSQAQLTIKLLSVPVTTPDNSDIYVAGTFNNWDPGNTGYKLKTNLDNTREITINPTVGTHMFKFTRGSWATVEGTSQGGFIANRNLVYTGTPMTIELTIAGWEGVSNTASTASPQVKILSDSFYMPQLDRYRKIWIYLPKDYSDGLKNYPVLYMHDGQNLFDKKTSFAGEWQVDEALDSLYQIGDFGAIVVGIDNGGGKRLDEYSPWINPQYGGGEGDKYVDFIAKTLKPYIDTHYRTNADADHTGIMGSSMGGLISFYAGLKFPDIFGRVGALSSSYWFSPKSFQYVDDVGVGSDTYIYMIAGSKEGGSQVKDMNDMYDNLRAKGAAENQLLKWIHSDGQHSEWYWRREFPKAYQWLFQKKSSDTKEENGKIKFSVYQSGDRLIIQGFPSDYLGNVNILNTNGKLIVEKPFSPQISLTDFTYPTGIYIIQIGTMNRQVLITK